MTNKKEPEIRFKGFEEEWKEEKFTNLFAEKRLKTSEENEDILLSCSINGIYLNSELFSHFRGSSNIGYLKIEKNDLILSAQNLHLGNANVNLKYSTGIISPAYKVYSILKSDPYFIQFWIKRDKTKNFFLNVTTEGASGCRKNVEWSYLYEQYIKVPKSIIEQQKIGSLLSNIDTLITSQELKLKKLQTIKQSLLDKMFASHNERVPKIRFKGFEDSWNFKRLNELANKFDNLRIPVSEKLRKSGDIPYYGANGIQDYVSGYTHDGEFVLVAEDGANDLNNYPSKYVNGKFWANNHVHVIQGKENILDNKFLSFVIKNFNFKPLLTGGDRSKLNASTLDIIQINNPLIKEQQKIGSLLSNLDSLITSQEFKIEKLNNIKKSLLEKMFC
ncbi:restriction endonuclease subunit S [Mycoplasma sp. Sp33II]|uniref:restriction endonuclease subunit S n=1 Tax=unclassified Mycoplasma TaxID=2683645 RepID=UPI003AAEC2A1